MSSPQNHLTSPFLELYALTVFISFQSLALASDRLRWFSRGTPSLLSPVELLLDSTDPAQQSPLSVNILLISVMTHSTDFLRLLYS